MQLWQSFKDNLQIEDPSLGAITLQQRTLGELVLPSGQVVACDPFVNPDTEAFQATLAPGRYPVIASIASFAMDNDQRIAYARIQLSSQPPVRWKLATLPGQDLNTLKEGEIFGYPVDAGTACFMDVEAANELQKKDLSYLESLSLSLGSSNDLNVVINPANGANVIMFSSGWGDGFYASYWGYDAEDKTVCLVTDFDLIEPPTLKSSKPPSSF